MKHLNALLDRLFADGSLNHLALAVGRGGETLYETCRSADRRVTPDTRFDMASVTKILCPTLLALLAIERGQITPDTPVSRFFPCPPAYAGLTVRHLMTHTMGYGWKSLSKAAAAGGFTPRDIPGIVLSIPPDIPVGSEVRYSCPGYILLGRLMEVLYGGRLDALFTREIALPLGMTDTAYRPADAENGKASLTPDGRGIVNANLSPDECGIVNDNNCRFFGRVAGNAGIFSTLTDMKKYARCLVSRGSPLLARETLDAAIENLTPGMAESRGLGFMVVDDRYTQTGGLFPAGSVGHCGHTGQSVFADPRTGLFAVILTDATVCTVRKYGQEHYGEVMAMRHDLHEAIRLDGIGG